MRVMGSSVHPNRWLVVVATCHNILSANCAGVWPFLRLIHEFQSLHNLAAIEVGSHPATWMGSYAAMWLWAPSGSQVPLSCWGGLPCHLMVAPWRGFLCRHVNGLLCHHVDELSCHHLDQLPCCHLDELLRRHLDGLPPLHQRIVL
jgi:hypothetical protein